MHLFVALKTTFRCTRGILYVFLFISSAFSFNNYFEYDCFLTLRNHTTAYYAMRNVGHLVHVCPRTAIKPKCLHC